MYGAELAHLKLALEISNIERRKREHRYSADAVVMGHGMLLPGMIVFNSIGKKVKVQLFIII
jgi:hypothetical protein